MRLAAGILAGIVTISVVLYGCGGAKDETPDGSGPVVATPGAETVTSAEDSETAEEMVERWKEIAKSATRENPPLEETAELAAKIAVKNPHALLSLLDLVEDEQSSPYVKVLATLSLTPVIGPNVSDRLIEMAKSGNDGTTRACATNMLRQIPTDAVTAALKELKNDSEPRVQLYARIGLATRDVEERNNLYELWQKNEFSAEEKGTIVDALAASPAIKDIPLLLEVAADTEMQEGVRVLAVQTLGSVGGQEEVEALKKYAENDPSVRVKNTAQSALDQVNTRVVGRNQVTLPLQ